jgi:ABC-type taurine transport system ATPase subunit
MKFLMLNILDIKKELQSLLIKTIKEDNLSVLFIAYDLMEAINELLEDEGID